MFSWKDCHTRFINLSHRQDRLFHMLNELDRVQLEAERFEAIRTADHQWDYSKYGTMLNRTPGAVGCHVSQVEVMKEALSLGKCAFVMEDDLVFATDIKKRLDYIQDFVNEKAPDWDVIWLGGTFHVGPPHWHNGQNTLMPIGEHGRSNLGKDAEATDDPRIFRTFGAFSTHCYIVNVHSIRKILDLFDHNIHYSIGIDYLFINLQPQLKTFAMVPGSVKQIDNMSDIGHGITKFSGFAALNGGYDNSRYWWQDNMEDFDPSTFDWKEAANGR